MPMYRFFIYFLFFTSMFCCQAKPIEDFAVSDLQIEKAQIRKNSTDDLVEGGRFADIFFIEPKDQETIVIKRFPKKENKSFEFRKEKEAFSYFSKKQIRSFTTPRLIKSAEDDEYYYLVMSKAKGISLNQMLKKRQMLPFWERQSYDLKIKQALKNLSISLYELHHLNAHSSIKKISSNSKGPDALFQRVSKEFKNKAQIHQKFQILRLKMKDKSIAFGVTHGDLHLGNIFFDQETQSIELIDFSTLSGHDQENAKMAISEEVASFVAHFKAIAFIYGIQEEESEYLLQAFYENYPHYSLMKEEVTYYQIITFMKLVDICQEGSTNFQVNSQMKKIAAFSKRSISSQLIS